MYLFSFFFVCVCVLCCCCCCLFSFCYLSWIFFGCLLSFLFCLYFPSFFSGHSLWLVGPCVLWAVSPGPPGWEHQVQETKQPKYSQDRLRGSVYSEVSIQRPSALPRPPDGARGTETLSNSSETTQPGKGKAWGSSPQAHSSFQHGNRPEGARTTATLCPEDLCASGRSRGWVLGAADHPLLGHPGLPAWPCRGPWGFHMLQGD